jgi:hypothetical protein
VLRDSGPQMTYCAPETAAIAWARVVLPVWWRMISGSGPRSRKALAPRLSCQIQRVRVLLAGSWQLVMAGYDQERPVPAVPLAAIP